MIENLDFDLDFEIWSFWNSKIVGRNPKPKKYSWNFKFSWSAEVKNVKQLNQQINQIGPSNTIQEFES